VQALIFTRCVSYINDVPVAVTAIITAVSAQQQLIVAITQLTVTLT
jgi:hypothetical protein